MAGFIRESESIFTNYVKNVDKLYVDKLSLNLLMQASELMKKDLNDSFKYESENNIKDFQDDCWHLDPKIEQKLNKNSFQLPSCQISKSAREILQLVENILDEVTLSPESCAPKLFYTSRNIFEEYIWIVPEYHKNFLETIPQQVGKKLIDIHSIKLHNQIINIKIFRQFQHCFITTVCTLPIIL